MSFPNIKSTGRKLWKINKFEGLQCTVWCITTYNPQNKSIFLWINNNGYELFLLESTIQCYLARPMFPFKISKFTTDSPTYVLFRDVKIRHQSILCIGFCYILREQPVSYGFWAKMPIRVVYLSLFLPSVRPDENLAILQRRDSPLRLQYTLFEWQ